MTTSMQETGQTPEGEPVAIGRVPWGLLDCAAVIALTAVAVVALVNLLALVDATVALPMQALSLALPLATLAGVTIAWVHIRHRAVGALNGPARATPKEWLVGLGLGVGGFLAVNLVLGILVQIGAAVVGVDLPEPQPGLREAATDPALLPWMAISAVIVAPIAEEVFFRGMLFQALRRRTGRWTAIIVSAVLFAGAHVLAEPTWAGGALVFFLILPLGVFLAWVFDRRGTLLTPIVVHAAFNAITLLIMLLAAGEGVMAFLR